MLDITEYSVEVIKDPFSIIAGKRYEFLMDLDLDEEDELYTSNGIYIRAIYSVGDGDSRLIKYDLLEKTTDLLLDYDLEEDEEAELKQFCHDHWKESE
ncbi:pullulanase [Paenibacillus swuensis]|uniref:Pullulanase n=1 Tax=Paenibacillus swuensis TaxID=1178515 RepID=A0A172TKW3_9BACL|nr:DUF6509 family protein [Paenibacillus swuensis]ANE47670.1 pullulanase [Paenibacillus swuensis]